MSRKSKTSKEQFQQLSYGSIDLPLFNDIETDISELDFGGEQGASGPCGGDDSGFVEQMTPTYRRSISNDFYYDTVAPKKHLSENSLTESACHSSMEDCCADKYVPPGSAPRSPQTPDVPPDKKLKLSIMKTPEAASMKAKALCLSPDQLEEFSVEDLNRHLDFLKLFAEGVSNELVVLLQERDWLLNQVEVRYAFIEQLLKLQHDPDSAHYRAHLETKGVQMSVVT